MLDTILEIVNEIGFDGVYVDQVGNGGRRNCLAVLLPSDQLPGNQLPSNQLPSNHPPS